VVVDTRAMVTHFFSGVPFQASHPVYASMAAAIMVP
jgi:hypothetical protein